MSLQLAAQHLSTKGRGPDDTLVHMSRGEVKSLNDLAMAHGGQLTINPQTGLPEAGFLSSILPMVAGMALNAYAPGLGSVMTGALVGGASYLMNPKAGLMGGVMAGLGAYGGANMGEALATQGMQQAAGQKVAEEAAKESALQGIPAESASYFAKTVNPAQIAAEKGTDFMGRLGNMGQGVSSLGTEGGFSRLGQNMGGFSGIAKTGLAAAAPAMALQTPPPAAATGDKDMGQRYTYSANKASPLPAPDVPTYQKQATEQGNFGREQEYFVRPEFKAVTGEEAKNIYGFADGGPVERMSNNAAMGANTMYPMANMATSSFATPYQTPQSTNMLANMVAPSGGGAVNAMSGEPNMQGTRMAGGGEVPSYGFGGFLGDSLNDIGSHLGSMFKGGGDDFGNIGPMLEGAQAPAGTRYDPETKQYVPINPQQTQMAMGGIANLGSYSDGGRLLRGPGDGVSDSIPAMIGKKQPARLADGEFVVPARIVSEIGNGSTEAGARKLYAMMDRVQASRKNTIGKGKVAKNNRADKYLPA
jgi:hypothetical protein